ncbi:hypothetical protein A2334_01965 [Candidatus Roizmanbacteria bacterium RIFOXYB2_FULL_38_10]|uniref:Uncharacterized protein n=1 Tax=Candidatus Roizmanbacteria bacterium RIFOXYD1_FULL_38_12 TaxID=1802093 RepID=A0A1F7L235_9BACT|nr:MAG: hypothetical protein A3K47_05385 [Candidatus Roizmanbacteria bacterium RIFOXYA2_FULL_38_14]OGK64178.1 MAG: hypothetical protein A3K27_05385 [Candidatus Roizmanbacteria bacterium RIFOXYA1_FULL_37_12]OGK66024.1 MAG: hypothetical protein A3K38_05385 [Candidatus Roizmanbacteria bacterium RIFOXYB1_FULL_40_23]OGK67780.1 MAG: hypothetical protein A2334_01965 [Candidatus Roizmanbacteria bacterium RIFOXYB2_FULL_38_10]OGK70428.1 MAG: hypothetical protein A3K21_05390 [Candidatus Roizmanbacteria ba
MILVVSYFVLFAVNSFIFFLSNLLFPYYVVLGTSHIPKLWAIAHSTGVLALLNTFAIPFVRVYEKNKGKVFTTQQWMIYYLLLNGVGIWIISRFPTQFGLGVRAWWVIVLLAAVLDVVQGIVMMKLEKFRAKHGNRS